MRRKILEFQSSELVFVAGATSRCACTLSLSDFFEAGGVMARKSPIDPDMYPFKRSEKEWQEVLTPKEYQILRMCGTER
jgi:hypothetical protein